MKIFLSPSSQYDNPYNYGNYNEGTVCRLIAEKTQDLLNSIDGIECKIGSNTSMYDRVRESNEWKADLHICLHTNAYNKQAHGTECFVYNTVSYSPYASKILKNIVKLTGVDRGIKSGTSLYEVKATTCTCLYYELEFHDSNGQWIVENINELAFAIASAFGDCTPQAEEQNTNVLYCVQLGAFSTRERAEAYAKQLQKNYKLDTYLVTKTK